MQHLLHAARAEYARSENGPVRGYAEFARYREGILMDHMKKVRRSSSSDRSSVESGLSRVTDVSPGRPLDPATRHRLEAGFGHSFDKVRIHADAAADEAARAEGAVAFTVGQDIFFGAGALSPQTDGGMRLLAHEAAHVVQQSAADAAAGDSSLATADYLSLEQAADAASAAVVAGHMPPRPPRLDSLPA